MAIWKALRQTMFSAFVKSQRHRQLLGHAALLIAYVLTGWIGLYLAVPPGYATAIFLPAGIAVAAVFAFGASSLPTIFLASFLLNIFFGSSPPHNLDWLHAGAALVIAAASSTQAAVGGTLLRWTIGYPTALDNPRDLSFFLLLPPAFCLISATVSISGIWLLGVVRSSDLPSNWITWWVGDTLGVIVSLPIILVLFGEPRGLWRLRLRYVAFPMFLCFVLFVSIFIRVSKWEHEQSLLEFQLRSQQFADTTKANLEQEALFLDQLSSVFANRHDPITRQDFRNLVQQLLKHFPVIQAVEWAPRVLNSDRQAFEATERAEMPGFAIREQSQSGHLQQSSVRRLYYPVTYVEPPAANEAAIGYDLLSDAVRARALEAAVETGNTAASAPIRLVQERAEEASTLLIRSVPAGSNGPGVVLVVLRMASFAKSLTNSTSPTLGAKLIDTEAGSTLYNSLPSTLVSPPYEHTLDFGGRHFLLQTAPTAYYIAQHRGWQSWTVLAGGIFCAGLLGALLLLGSGHTYRFEKLVHRLQAREAELENIITRTPFMLIRCTPDLRYRFVSPAYAEMLGHRPEDLIGKSVAEIVGPEGFQTVLPHIQKVLKGERAEYEAEVDYMAVGKRFLHGVYTPDTDEDGKVIGWIASIVDLTERKRAEAQRDLLVAEINHRVKNTLATIVSIAHQSFSKERAFEESQRSFTDRIEALAQTHTRLAEANWSGMSLETIIRDETAPYRSLDNVRMVGPDVTLNPKQAVSLGLAIHELATNAAKYGALSTKNGLVQVAWEVTIPTSEVRITWIEDGGPTVTPPHLSGFGRLLLERALGSDLNGTVKLDFRKEGLHCLITFPLNAFSSKRSGYAELAPAAHTADGFSPGFTKKDQTSVSALAATRVLVVEDEALLALEIQDLLKAAGCKVVGPFSELGKASAAIALEGIDLALLDTNLNGEMVYPLADDLLARGIPCIFVTGYNSSDLPECFQTLPRIAKPFIPSALIELLRKAKSGTAANIAAQ